MYCELEAGCTANWRLDVLRTGGWMYCELEAGCTANWRLDVLRTRGWMYCELEAGCTANWRLDVLRTRGWMYCELEAGCTANWRLDVLRTRGWMYCELEAGCTANWKKKEKGYLWSVLLGHVEAGFPYISDTGTYPPESCVFGLLLDLYASVTAVIVYIRWQHVRSYYRTEGSRALHRANNFSLVLGLLASFGVLIVANFQETNVLVVHLIGALLAFGVGALYTWVQVYLTFTTCLPGDRLWLRLLRLLLSVAISVCCVLVSVFAQISTHKHSEEHTEEKGHFKWKLSDKGFTEHVISTALEWAMALMSALFFATFTLEFRHFTVAMLVEFTVVCMEVKDKAVAPGNGAVEGEFLSSRELSAVSYTRSSPEE
ncbi:hypothetical protein ACOMHN_065135 [Nucella lapillus]